ncbi:STM4015 family protein [Kitasatospora sp. NPDC004240]
MTVNEHIQRFHDLPVLDFREALDAGTALPDAAEAAWKIGVEYDGGHSFTELWERFLDTVDTGRVRAVVIGLWSDDPESFAGPLRAILDAASRLPALRALFVGDITYEECEISWLQLTDVTPLLTEFPLLEELVVRGASEDWDGTDGGLALRTVRHERLRALRFEAGGLPATVVRSVASCDFPALERLELWLGVANYGGDSTIDDLAPFLAGTALPALRHLGLQNSEYQDEIAAAVAQAPVVARLESLDLSMGVLTDEGATALLEGQPLTHLRSLDLHHHFLSKGLQQRLRDALTGVELDLSRGGEPDGRRRYVAVAE